MEHAHGAGWGLSQHKWPVELLQVNWTLRNIVWIMRNFQFSPQWFLCKKSETKRHQVPVCWCTAHSSKKSHQCLLREDIPGEWGTENTVCPQAAGPVFGAMAHNLVKVVSPDMTFTKFWEKYITIFGTSCRKAVTNPCICQCDKNW